ncbi:CDC27 family protein [Sulfurimonas sp.]|uniref:CDC27 family protein n=1 Tax=Sulfurimonas sp. TaxID=2022749 RepID=UPI00286E453C|nr:CDC27 family protein [Sulfurimonas sp.]
MYSLVKSSFFVLFFMLFSGCVATQPSAKKGHEKSFEYEDMYILSALHLEEIGDYNNSSNLFNTLYEASNKKEYLYRSLRNDLAANENGRAIKRVDEISKNSIDDFELTRIKTIALVKQNKLDEAKKLATRLVEASKSVNDYLLVSEIYVKLKEYESALKYLEGAYIKENNEKILESIAVILYVNLDRKKDAIAQLETHSRIHGCSVFICSKLIGFYSNDNNIDGLLSTYLRLYKIEFSRDIAAKIVQIYSYKKDFLKMTEFLEESRSDNELLLQLYIQARNYKKAATIANELYEESGDVTLLGQSAIFEYESSEDKSDKVMQKSVIAKLKETIEVKKEGMYLNYLGYLLIDHSIDIKKGIDYIKEALKIEPNSIYYLDSLAWGYYKLGDCKEAAKIMKKVENMDGSSNEEVVKHIETIKKCNESKKK